MDFTRKDAGWTVPKRYNTDVLLGNWYENRMEFTRGAHSDVNSSYRTVFLPSSSMGEDVQAAREKRLGGLLRNDGIPAKNLTHHHGEKFVDGLAVTSYDQDFARSAGTAQTRSWDKWHSEWRPERSDLLNAGTPTQTGAFDKMKAKWKKQALEEGRTNYCTTKQLSYTSPDASAFTSKRYATPRMWSTHLHPHVQNNDLNLRGQANGVIVERFQLADSTGANIAVAPVD
eukprot:scpid70240/ scgid18012/ Uncharacterized protein C1orf158 homolog